MGSLLVPTLQSCMGHPPAPVGLHVLLLLGSAGRLQLTQQARPLFQQQHILTYTLACSSCWPVCSAAAGRAHEASLLPAQARPSGCGLRVHNPRKQPQFL